MKLNIKIITLMLFLICPTLVLAKDDSVPAISIGVSGSFGFYNAWDRSNDSDKNRSYGQGLGYGGGLIFEKMINRSIGIQSGLWYAQYSHGFTYYDEGAAQVIDTDLEMEHISIPLYLLIPFDSKTISINFLIGINYNHIISAHFVENDTSYITDDDVLKYTYTSQFAASGGFMLKFHTGTYADLFVGALGDFSLSDFLDDKSNIYTHSFNYRVIAGMMIRTNLIN